MNENTVISWILLATSYATEKEPANIESISQIADGINKAIPTHKELHGSLSWLAKNGLVKRTGKMYHMTNEGTALIAKAKSRTNNIILNIWDALATEIENTKEK